MAAEDRLEAGEVQRALVIQLPPEGANSGRHVVGFGQERLHVGDWNVPETRQARCFDFNGISEGLYLLDDVLGVAAPEVSDGALAVGSQECAQQPDGLL